MTRAHALSTPRVAIAGAGIVGLSIASVLATRGYGVTLFDPAEPGRGASWAAAGMLAPAYEAAGHDGHNPALLEACFESKRLWHEWADWLGADTDGGLRFVGSGSFALAVSDEDIARLQRMGDTLESTGWSADWLEPEAISKWEPGLAPGVRAALALTSDGRVDNRLVVAALRRKLASCPKADLVQGAAPLKLQDGRLVVDGHDMVVACAGWQTPELRVDRDGSPVRLGELAPELAAIEPVKGQMLSVSGSVDLAPRHTLRHRSLYIVPRHDRVIIGATSQPGVHDRLVDGGSIAELRRAAEALLPALSDRGSMETWAGVRPGSPDHAPLIGAASVPGLVLACGHHRNGILLSPLTAEWVVAAIEGGRMPHPMPAFSPGRFLPAPV